MDNGIPARQSVPVVQRHLGLLALLLLAVLAIISAGPVEAAVSPAAKRAALIAACFRAQGHKVTDADGGRLPKGATAGVAWFSADTYITYSVSSFKGLEETVVIVNWGFAVKQLVFNRNACVRKYSTR